jgi:hypothetical protein
MSDDRREVLQDRAMGMVAVFRPLRRGRREKLDVETTWGEASIRWRGADQLGIGDQSVLLAVLEVAMEQLRQGARVRTDDGLWRKLGHQRHVFMPELVRVVTSYRRLAMLTGDHDGGCNFEEVRASLARLAETTVWVRLGEFVGSSRLLGWEVGDDSEVVLALNWRLTQALQGSSSYARISIAERSRLRSERAKALHAVLSCKVDVGKAWDGKLEHLQRYLWGDTLTEGSTRRQRHGRLRVALAEIERLPGWTATVSGDKVRVARGRANWRSASDPGASVTPRSNRHESPEQRSRSKGTTASIGAGFQAIDASVLIQRKT